MSDDLTSPRSPAVWLADLLIEMAAVWTPVALQRPDPHAPWPDPARGEACDEPG
jgi:hypothetical protein